MWRSRSSKLSRPQTKRWALMRAEARQTYQPAFKRTVSGTPVTVTDAAEGADLSRLTLKGRTLVSDTPSPTAR